MPEETKTEQAPVVRGSNEWCEGVELAIATLGERSNSHGERITALEKPKQ